LTVRYFYDKPVFSAVASTGIRGALIL